MFGGSAEHLQKTEPNTTEHFMLKWPRFGNILSIFLKKNSKKIKILSLAKRQKIIRTKERTRCCLFWVQNIEADIWCVKIFPVIYLWSDRFGSVRLFGLFCSVSVRFGRTSKITVRSFTKENRISRTSGFLEACQAEKSWEVNRLKIRVKPIHLFWFQVGKWPFACDCTKLIFKFTVSPLSFVLKIVAYQKNILGPAFF